MLKQLKVSTYKRVTADAPKDLQVYVTTAESGKYKLTCKGVDNQTVYISIYNKLTGVVFEDYVDLKGKDFSKGL